MSCKKSGTTASSGNGKSGEQKDDNFLAKTARSIRDKVQGLTGDVKEKTQNLTRNSESKNKRKRLRNRKTKDTETNSSSKSATSNTKDSDSDSNDENGSIKPRSPRSIPPGTGDKSDISRSKPSSSSSEIEKTNPERSARLKIPSNQSPSNNSASKPSDDDSVRKPSHSSSNKESNGDTDGDEVTNKRSSTKKNTDKVHLSFDGVSTVDDLLNRIDETVEQAKLVIEGGSGKIGLNIDRVPSAAKLPPSDLEKRPKEEVKDKNIKVDKQEETPKNKEEQVEDKEEPIHIEYNEIHTIGDLLGKVSHEQGNRKVILENEPGNSNSITAEKPTNSSSITFPTSKNPNNDDDSDDDDDTSTATKSILKKSQDPSSLDTTTKTLSFQDDQIHVNLENVQNLADLLDCVDDAVQQVPVVIDTKSQEKKRQAPLPPNQKNNNNELKPKTSVSTKEQEGTSMTANDENTKDESLQVTSTEETALELDNKQTKDVETLTLKISRFDDNEPRLSSSTSNNKKEEDEEVDRL
ncbi:unnamed protein product [Rotaria sordida]|uniref:Uncharacterized protein n=1 Tax=Rotaria sordida TaxID=392033 RepID=A0A818WF04_9BILA|nr:unnamed protein product [Rotaria sordida]CAF3723333.1 unnamed protein product [Rotaria sordida]